MITLLTIHIDAYVPLGAIIVVAVFILGGFWALLGGVLQLLPRTPRYIRKINKSMKRADRANKEMVKLYKRQGLLD